LAIREKELEFRERPNKGRISFTPTTAALLVALLGIFGTLLGSFLQGRSNLALEQRKFESDIILKAATSDNIEQNKKNLKFLLDAGFIHDNEQKLRRIITDSVFTLKIQDQQSTGAKLPLSPEQTKYADSAFKIFAFYRTACSAMLQVFERIDSAGLDDISWVSALDSAIERYSSSYKKVSDTALLSYALQTYWPNSSVIFGYRRLIQFLGSDIHGSIFLRLNEDVIDKMNQLFGTKGLAKRAELSGEVKRSIKKLIPQLKIAVEELQQQVNTFLRAAEFD
jgi:hypothetical protein